MKHTGQSLPLQLTEMCDMNIILKSVYVYSEISCIAFSRAYSQVRVHKCAMVKMLNFCWITLRMFTSEQAIFDILTEREQHYINVLHLLKMGVRE